MQGTGPSHHLTYRSTHKPAQPRQTQEHVPGNSAAMGISLREATGAGPHPSTRIHPVRTESQPPRQLGAPTRGRALLGTVTTTSTRHSSVTIAPQNPWPVTPAVRPHTCSHPSHKGPSTCPRGGTGESAESGHLGTHKHRETKAHTELLWCQPPEVSTRSRQGRLRPRLSRQRGCSLPSTRTTPGRGALQPQGRADATAITTGT